MNDENLSNEEALNVVSQLRDEHSFDTSTDDQDEP